MKSLDEMAENEELIYAVIPVLQNEGERDKFQILKLRGAETGGIWVESQGATNELWERYGVKSASITPVFFVPFHHVKVILDAVQVPSFSEKETLG